MVALVVPVVLVFSGPALLRHWAMGEEQRAALALMDAPPASLRGDNAFPWLATANNDVPESELQAAIDEDNRHYKAYLDGLSSRPIPEGGLDLQYRAFQQSAYPSRKPLSLGEEACQLGFGGSRCLAMVQAKPAATRRLIDGQAPRLENARRALASGHVANAYRDYLPFVDFEPLALELTASALDAVEGRVPEAMQRTCRLLAWGRDQAGRTTFSEVRGQLWSTWEAASSLLLDLRLAYPDAALPRECREALAPVASAEFEVCELARGQWRTQRSRMPRSTESINPSWRVVHAALDHILFDEALGNAWLAQRHAPLCSEATRLAIANGAALPKPPAFRPTPMACAAARKQCERLRWPLGFESTLYASWNELTDSQATLQLLDAAHASLGRGGDDEAPDIPGYPVRHDAREQTWTLQLRRYDTERVVRFGTPGAAPVQ